MLTRQKR